MIELRAIKPSSQTVSANIDLNVLYVDGRKRQSICRAIDGKLRWFNLGYSLEERSNSQIGESLESFVSNPDAVAFPTAVESRVLDFTLVERGSISRAAQRHKRSGSRARQSFRTTAVVRKRTLDISSGEPPFKKFKRLKCVPRKMIGHSACRAAV